VAQELPSVTFSVTYSDIPHMKKDCICLSQAAASAFTAAFSSRSKPSNRSSQTELSIHECGTLSPPRHVPSGQIPRSSSSSDISSLTWHLPRRLTSVVVMLSVLVEAPPATQNASRNSSGDKNKEVRGLNSLKLTYKQL